MDSWDTAIPDWQINEVRKRKEYYTQHPDELIDWEDAQKMINTDYCRPIKSFIFTATNGLEKIQNYCCA